LSRENNEAEQKHGIGVFSIGSGELQTRSPHSTYFCSGEIFTTAAGLPENEKMMKLYKRAVSVYANTNKRISARSRIYQVVRFCLWQAVRCSDEDQRVSATIPPQM
jgi:hypothetical protein